jgi:hypothetical protein
VKTSQNTAKDTAAVTVGQADICDRTAHSIGAPKSELFVGHTICLTNRCDQNLWEARIEIDNGITFSCSSVPPGFLRAADDSVLRTDDRRRYTLQKWSKNVELGGHVA